MLKTDYRFRYKDQLLESIFESANETQRSTLSDAEKQEKLQNLHRQVDLQRKLLDTTLGLSTDQEAAVLEQAMNVLVRSFDWGSDRGWDQAELWFDWVRGGLARDARFNGLIQDAFITAYQSHWNIALAGNVMADYLLFKRIHRVLKEFGPVALGAVRTMSKPLSIVSTRLEDTNGEVVYENGQWIAKINRASWSDELLASATLREEIVHVLLRIALKMKRGELSVTFGFTHYITPHGTVAELTPSTKHQSYEPYWIKRVGDERVIFGKLPELPEGLRRSLFYGLGVFDMFL